MQNSLKKQLFIFNNNFETIIDALLRSLPWALWALVPKFKTCVTSNLRKIWWAKPWRRSCFSRRGRLLPKLVPRPLGCCIRENSLLKTPVWILVRSEPAIRPPSASGLQVRSATNMKDFITTI